MSSLAVAGLCGRLAAAWDPQSPDSGLAEALVRDWGADAAVVWTATTGAGQTARTEDNLFVAGGLPPPESDLLAELKQHRIEQWLAERAFQASCVADLRPPEAGQLVVAWRDGSAMPPQIGAALTFIAAHLSLLRDQKQIEERLAAAAAALLEAEDQISRTRRTRALGEMASGVVHDFNNCLTSILGFAELALGPLEEGDAFFDGLSSIRMAALDAAALVRRLQNFGRKGRESDERETVDLRAVVRVMPTLARPRYMQASECHGVAFDIVVDPQPVPPVHVVVAEIRELLLNLLFNAIDAMPSGGRITITTGQTEDGWATIAVSDQGTGMSEEVRRQIFQPFFSTKGDGGSGLGLSACKTIAKRHKAELDVESTPGVGTTFTLRLPPASPGFEIAVRSEASVTRPLALQRVVLVDDQKEVRESVGEMLRAMGHDVTAVDCGEAAVALAGRQRIDVVITDFGMPGFSGLAVAQRFRVLMPRVPIVLLTGWGLDPDTVRPANVVCVLRKPVTMKVLSDALTACTAEPVEAWSEKCS
jgi:signal transduction histidine kinase/ActR/RegA family two-component response regulator